MAGCRRTHQVVQAQLLQSVLAGLPHARVVLVVQLHPTQPSALCYLSMSDRHKTVGQSRIVRRVSLLLRKQNLCGTSHSGNLQHFVLAFLMLMGVEIRLKH